MVFIRELYQRVDFFWEIGRQQKSKHYPACKECIIEVCLLLLYECRTKHPGTKHPMPFFDTPDKTSRIDLPPRTKHPMQILSPRTKHPMPFLPPRTKHPMPFLPPRTKHPTLCLKPMIVHKTSHLVNCHYD